MHVRSITKDYVALQTRPKGYIKNLEVMWHPLIAGCDFLVSTIHHVVNLNCLHGYEVLCAVMGHGIEFDGVHRMQGKVEEIDQENNKNVWQEIVATREQEVGTETVDGSNGM